MIYVISGVSNDALTMPAVAIFMLGIIRFYEKKYNILTYFVIAAGINLSLLSKLTTGMIVCIIALGIVLFTFFKEKRLSPLLIGDSLLRSPCMEYLLSTSGRFIKDSIQFNRITKLSPNKNLCRVECIAILILVDRWGMGVSLLFLPEIYGNVGYTCRTYLFAA